jgi:hypothetical protein
MNQKNTDSIRFSPLALALALLFVLGFFALQAHAQEYDGTDTTSVREKIQQHVAERVAVNTEENEKRQMLQESVLEDSALGDRAQERLENREEVREMREAYVSERVQLRNEQREEMHTMYLDRKDALLERIEERKQVRAEKVSERKAGLEERAQERIQGYATRILERMQAALGRLTQIADRITLRIEKLEEADIDLTDAKAELEDVYVLIEDAKEYIEIMNTTIADALTSEEPAAQKEEVRESITLAKDGLKAIHTALTETVVLVKASSKDMMNEEEGENTDTETVTDDEATEE